MASNNNSNVVASLNISIGANADVQSVAKSVKQVTDTIKTGLRGKNPVINPEIIEKIRYKLENYKTQHSL
ncbi:MAG: hypothetical protein IJ213_01695 [Bacteroidales bacterium]|nr:hypothetical protein [Bacteroidales bacterium]